MAEACLLLGRPSEAARLYRQAIVILEKILGTDHPELAVALSNLASVYLTQKRYLEAEALFQRALAIKERTPWANPS